MSRTYRRRSARYNLDWVLRDYIWINGHMQRIVIDPKTREGRKALARYFSDCKPNKMNGWAKHRVLGHCGFGKLRREIAAKETLKEMEP